MEIRCKNCHAKLNIPDEKVPRGQRVAISCPKCRERLTLDTNADAGADSVSAVKEKKSSTPKKTESTDAYEAEGSALEFFEEGVRRVLVAESDPVRSEKIRDAIEDMGYKYVAAENTNQAISKMRFHTFDLVILSNQFDDIELGQSPIRQYLNHLSMSVRRKMFVVLIGDAFNTMDHMMAFAMSANLVINSRDLDNLGGILKNAMSENEKFYKVYMDILSEVGKA